MYVVSINISVIITMFQQISTNTQTHIFSKPWNQWPIPSSIAHETSSIVTTYKDKVKNISKINKSSTNLSIF